MPRPLPKRIRAACQMAQPRPAMPRGDEPCEERCYLRSIYGGNPWRCGEEPSAVAPEVST